jgi:hypothetical protein
MNYAKARRRERFAELLMPPLIVSWIWLLIWGGDSLLVMVVRLSIVCALAVAGLHNAYHWGYRTALEDVSRG